MLITWGSGVRAKMIAGQKGQLSLSSSARFVAGPGMNAVGEEDSERGSSNCECFATSAENTDEKWQICS